jgi:hypothetical protein
MIIYMLTLCLKFCLEVLEDFVIKNKREAGMAAHTCNLSPQKAEAEGS